MWWCESLGCLAESFQDWNEDVPSERKIQARRKVKRLGRDLISLGVTIFPTRFHPCVRPAVAPCVAPLVDWRRPGSPRQAGIVNTAHQIALAPTATRREEVVPPIIVTGMIRSAKTDTPDKNPRAVPIDEIREIVSERRAL
jgi:hypothetical protein